ncbi:MAG TPA: Hint domain-containing protein [Acetobacteraceae bacterium]|nr:Hint domain-containing protein [Acetobacteraceae bacterium]
MTQFTWNGTSGTWTLAANWLDMTNGGIVPPAPPGAPDDAAIAGLAGFSFLDVTGPGNSASLSVTRNVGLSGAFTTGALTVGTGNISGGDQLDLLVGTTLSASSVAVTDGTLALTGAGTKLTDSGALTLGSTASFGPIAGSLLLTNQAAAQLGSVTMTGFSTISVDTTVTLEIGTSGAPATGALTVDAGATLSGTGNVSAKVVDNGTITASGGSLAISGVVSGSGTLQIGGGATLLLNNNQIGTAIDFTGSGGTLDFGGFISPFSPLNVTGTIADFAAGDNIAFNSSTIDSAVWAAAGGGLGTLTLSAAGSTIAKLTLKGDYTAENFYALSAGIGSTIVLGPVSLGGAAPVGTTSADDYAWIGTGGAWGTTGNWADLTAGGSSAALAPGSKDAVTIKGAAGQGFDMIAGPGNSSSLTTTQNVALVGAFAIGALTVGAGGNGGGSDVLDLVAGTTLSASSVAVQDGSLALTGAGTRLTDSGALTLGSLASFGPNPGTLSLTSKASAQVASVTMIGSSTIKLDSTASLEVGTGGAPVAGALTVDSGATVSGIGTLSGAVVDNGTITATGGPLTIQGAVSGSGTLQIGGGATLNLTNSQIGAAIDFAGSGGTLNFGGFSPFNVTGTISDFVAGDNIMFGSTKIDAAVWTASGGGLGTLTVSNAGSVVGKLTLKGDYTGETFYVIPSTPSSAIVIAPAPLGGPAPAGTAAADDYAWIGTGGAWGDATNWTDRTLAASPAAVPPGVHDAVTITGAPGAGFEVISGPGNSASLTVTQNLAVSGAFNTGALTLGSSTGVGTVGTLDLLAGTTLSASSVAVNDGRLALTGAGTRLTDSGTLTVGSKGSFYGLDGALSLTNHASAQVGDVTLTQPPPSSSSITVDSTASLEVGTGGTSTAGAVTVDAGATLSGAGSISGKLVDNGTVSAIGGGLSISGDVSGSGKLQIGAGATLSLVSGSIATDIDFVGSGGTLSFASFLGTFPFSETGTISGFVSSDNLVFSTARLDQAVWAASGGGLGTLTLSASGKTLATLTLAGDYSNESFFANPSGFSGTTISTSLLCFCAGTRILTDGGEVPVEALRPGDRVATRSGFRPIAWIGHRRVDLARHAAPDKLRPVRIRRDAFGPGAPHRDLLLSPDHAVFVEEVLIPVKHLVNGDTVRVDRSVTRPEYFHVELDEHDVLFAEGLPAESLVPDADRSAFDHGDAPIQLHPDFHSLAWEAGGCAPLTVTGPLLDKVRGRLAARAVLLGRSRERLSA